MHERSRHNPGLLDLRETNIVTELNWTELRASEPCRLPACIIRLAWDINIVTELNWTDCCCPGWWMNSEAGFLVMRKNWDASVRLWWCSRQRTDRARNTTLQRNWRPLCVEMLESLRISIPGITPPLSSLSWSGQGAYNSGKPGKLPEFFNSGKLWGILNLLREFL